MKKPLIFVLLLWWWAAAGFATLPGAALAEARENPPHFFIGAAVSPITPLEEHLKSGLYLGGYGFGKERGPAQGIRDEIWSRAVAVSDGLQTVVLVVLDLPGIRRADLNYIRQQGEALTGVPLENILVSITHTHAGPDLQGLWGGVPAAYRDYVREQAVESIKAAVKSLLPGKITVAAADYPDGIRNRRGGSLSEPALQIMHTTSLTGETIATLLVYGAHATFFGSSNRHVSADFCGWAVVCLEEELGGTALFMAGVQGDQTPNKRDLEMEQYSFELSEAALAALKAEPVEVAPAYLELRRSVIDMAIRNPALILASVMGYLRHNDLHYRLIRGISIPVEVNYLQLGDGLSFVTVPGEALARLGLEIKALSKTKHTFFLGLTNGSLGYLLHEDEWQGGIPFVSGGYEESVSLGRHAGPAVRERLRALIVD
jgi:hypothetical protein